MPDPDKGRCRCVAANRSSAGAWRGPPPPAGHVILHNRDAAWEAVLVPKPLEDPFRRMQLLLRPRLVVPENAVDHWNKWIKLRLRRRLLAHVTRRHRELHHLVHSPRIDPEPARRRPLAQSLNSDRMPHLQIEIHVLHPSPSAESKAKGYLLPDFYSGATGLPGRFSEGLSLRRLHPAKNYYCNARLARACHRRGSPSRARAR